jgi:predicted nucleic-acid-binding Zn-ribbon protein
MDDKDLRIGVVCDIAKRWTTLTPEDYTKIQEGFTRKLAPACGIGCCCTCNHAKDWKIAEKLVKTIPVAGEEVNAWGETDVYPLVMITCTNCGDTRFYNARVLGIRG